MSSEGSESDGIVSQIFFVDFLFVWGEFNDGADVAFTRVKAVQPLPP